MSKNYSLNATPPNEQRIPAEDAVIDPLVPTMGANNMAGSVTLKTIEMVHEALGAIINLGASNVSLGLHERHTIKQVFLSLAIAAGATWAITDPMKLSMTIRADFFCVVESIMQVVTSSTTGSWRRKTSHR